jgi:hypothetical protein
LAEFVAYLAEKTKAVGLKGNRFDAVQDFIQESEVKEKN